MRWTMLTVVAVVSFLQVTIAFAENWPAWRGPKGDGICREKNLPVTWSSTENVLWTSPLPGAGNSTPIIWKNRVFITCPVDGGKQRCLIAFDRTTGKKLWTRTVPYPAKETRHRDNPFCSGSPTTDGKLVYAGFGSAGVLACDFEGNVVWHRKLGKLTHVFGQATTPVLYGDLVIVHRGPGVPTSIVALNKRTGKTVWERPERGKNHNLYGSWCTPLIFKTRTRDEMIVSMPEEIKGYDPKTGKPLWTCKGLGTEIYSMPVPGSDLVVAISGHNGPALAVRPGGNGDVTDSRRLWQVPRNQQRVGCGVIHDGYFYQANATGVAQCINTKSGKEVWNKRLGGTLWGTMLLADGRLYVSSQEGITYVVSASPKFELIAENDIGEHMKAAIAPSDGQFFLRTYKNLHCVTRGG